MSDPRTKKRAIIISVYAVIFFSILFLLYSIISPEPSCFDSKQNQNEKSVDCGGVCAPCSDISNAQDLALLENSLVFGGNDTYDGLVKISNPNNTVGASSFSYEARVKDGEGVVIDEKSGGSFILPAETKYVIITGFEVGGKIPAKFEFEIADVRWEEFTEYQKPQISVYGKRFNLLSNMVGGEVYGIMKNESSFDFNTIKVNVILRDSSNRPIAVNMTQMNTVRAGEERDFRLTWPYQLPGEVTNIETEAEADTYNSQNFLKTYIPEQKLPFQY